MTEYAGRGDAARTMALLWRTTGAERPDRPTPRGPKQRLDVERVVAEAVAIADRDGLGAVSMRRVAEALGVGTMSLYTYIPGKAELLELMVDRVTGEQPLPAAGDEWRRDLDEYAHSTWDLYRLHPWLVQIATARTVFGPNVIARYEAALGLVAGLGWSATDVVGAVSLVDGFVRGAAQALVQAEQATASTGQSEDDWWTSRAPLLDEQLAGGDYPNLAALAEAGAFDQAQEERDYMVQQAVDEFEFGLARILDGLAQLGRAT